MMEFCKIKITAVFAAAMTIGLSMPSYAAYQWVQENENWYYQNSKGERTTDDWQKTNGKYYYLGEDGAMLVNQFVEDGDDLYYVGEDGTRVYNQWVSVPNEGDHECDQDIATVWYYFGKKGTALKADDGGKVIPYGENKETKGKFFFDDDGHMLSGWQTITNSDGEENVYYLGTEDEGHAYLLWQKLEPSDDMFGDYDGKERFYFGWEGKMSRNTESKIGGSYYIFDENGVMRTGWQPGVEVSSPDFAGVNAFYDLETGARVKGWLYAYAPEDENESGDPAWYYMMKDGHAYNEGGAEGGEDGNQAAAAKRINGNTYVFDQQGRMVTGLIDTRMGAEASEYINEDFEDVIGCGLIGGASTLDEGIYYFEEDETNDTTIGRMVKDKKLYLEDDGNNRHQFYFRKNGMAYANNLVNGYLYGPDGALVCADKGKEAVELDFDVYSKEVTFSDFDETEPLICEGSTVIVSSSGRLLKNGSSKIDGIRYTVKDYVVVSYQSGDTVTAVASTSNASKAATDQDAVEAAAADVTEETAENVASE